MSKLNVDKNGKSLIAVKQHIRTAQYKVLKAVNQELIALY